VIAKVIRESRKDPPEELAKSSLPLRVGYD